MTFGNFILALRKRLQDMRKTDASLITVITEDGSRWTSAELIEIANSTFIQLTRIIVSYSKVNPIMKQLAETNAMIAGTTGTATAGVVALPTDSIGVIEVSLGSNRSYGWISPELYLSYLTSNAQPRSEGYFYTILLDPTAGTRKIYLLPTTEAGTVSITYIRTKSNYAAADTAVDLSLQNIDDLLLDIAEREARDREHNWERSKILDLRIMSKLGINVGG